MKYILLVALFIILTGCQSNAPKIDMSRAYNINGKWVEISQEMQNDIRKRWSENSQKSLEETAIPTSSDKQYILDSISLQEIIASEKECKEYELYRVEKTNVESLSSEDKRYPVGRLDEVWDVSACGNKARYRVIELADDRGLSSYRLRP